jgi:hypothetical protein
MELYKHETEIVVNRFLRYRISFPKCIAALDAALAGLVPRLTAEQIAPLRAIMLVNNETVMTEMERRGGVMNSWCGTRPQ